MRSVYIAIVQKSPSSSRRIRERLRHFLREWVNIQLETIIRRILQYFKEISVYAATRRVREIQVVCDANVLKKIVETSSVVEPVGYRDV